VEIEFMRDARDGQSKLLEVNARTWGFISLGEAAHVNFPYLLFAEQVGAVSEPCRGLDGIGWLRLVTDVPTAINDMLTGHLSVRSYLESLRHTRTESVFSREDPLPSLAELAFLPYLAAKKYF
jgi:predicted ATP-grasp superfamily ATP-dependent carboligase